jgi:hypothetical protein
MTVSLIMAGTLAETAPALKTAAASRKACGHSLRNQARRIVAPGLFAKAIFRRMREATCQPVGNLQIVAISESIRSLGASAFRRKPKRYPYR